jgi:hypothetical protein
MPDVPQARGNAAPAFTADSSSLLLCRAQSPPIVEQPLTWSVVGAHALRSIQSRSRRSLRPSKSPASHLLPAPSALPAVSRSPSAPLPGRPCSQRCPQQPLLESCATAQAALGATFLCLRTSSLHDARPSDNPASAQPSSKYPGLLPGMGTLNGHAQLNRHASHLRAPTLRPACVQQAELLHFAVVLHALYQCSAALWPPHPPTQHAQPCRVVKRHGIAPSREAGQGRTFRPRG